ncbi:MFS general substrate transporter [Byssothecium circinans]|uniref:MFS general substrate transporter n=1 Tax=Byssothecium circinans TaxID=147558 RepID=A0A6A5TG83_9PLEO|nr:MFS general substrate transporter [Byssothecium circinans]
MSESLRRHTLHVNGQTAIITAAIFFESVWLAKKGRNEEALKSLIWIRGGDSPEVQTEMQEILAGIESENAALEGLTWREFLQPANRYRMIITITLQIGVQLTGNTSLAYYAPQVFGAVGAGDSKMLISGFFGLVKVVSCGFFLVFLVERIGHRWALIGGSFMMGALMLIVACLSATHPPKATGGPVPWLYVGEIFSTRTREVGIAFGTATQWLFNFVFSQATPVAVTNLGWKVFLMFCIFNWALVIYAFFFTKETTGRSLEDMDRLFAGHSMHSCVIDPEGKVVDENAKVQVTDVQAK